MLWRIINFDSAAPLPPRATAPTLYDQHSETRSYWSPQTSEAGHPAQYMRLLQFSCKDCIYVYMRFSLFSAPNYKPVLAICNGKSKVFFWDLSRLSAYADYSETIAASQFTSGDIRRPSFLTIPNFTKVNRFGAVRERSTRSSVHEITQTTGTETARSSPYDEGKETTRQFSNSRAGWEKQYTMGEPQTAIKPHLVEVVPTLAFVGRQVAWSIGGEWCVVVGTENAVTLFAR